MDYQRQLNLQRLAQQELEMKTRLDQQRQLTLAREQLVQNPQLVITIFSTFSIISFSSFLQPMAPYDYNQVPPSNPIYQSAYATLPPQQMIDPTNQYSSMLSFAPQPSLPMGHYPSMMTYSPKTDTNVIPSQAVPLPIQSIPFPMAVNRGKSIFLYSKKLTHSNKENSPIQSFLLYR